jgi:hypothetical protein
MFSFGRFSSTVFKEIILICSSIRGIWEFHFSNCSPTFGIFQSFHFNLGMGVFCYPIMDLIYISPLANEVEQLIIYFPMIWILFEVSTQICLPTFEMGSHYVTQASLQHLASDYPPTSASRVAGTMDVYQHVQLPLFLFILIYVFLLYICSAV